MPRSIRANPVTEEEMHGVMVDDPYRWLEVRGSGKTEAWIRGRNEDIVNYFDPLPSLSKIRGIVTDYVDRERIDQPLRFGGRLYFRRRRAGQEQPGLWVKNEEGMERELFAPDAAAVALNVSIRSLSPDGKILACDFRNQGSDASEIAFLDLHTGLWLPDRFKNNGSFSFAFSSKNDGLYYAAVETSTSRHHVLFHRFGSSVLEDVCVFSADESCGNKLTVLGDGIQVAAYLKPERGVQIPYRLWIMNMAAGSTWRLIPVPFSRPIVPLLYGGRSFVYSQDEASASTIVELAANGSRRTVMTFQTARVEQFVITTHDVYVSYVEEGSTRIRRWGVDGDAHCDPDGTLLPLPEGGTIAMIRGTTDVAIRSMCYSYQSFFTRLSFYEYDPVTNSSVDLFPDQNSSTIESRYEVREDSVKADDSVCVPILQLASAHQQTRKNGATILTVYGGFGVPYTPTFSVFARILIDLGVTYVIAKVRGGGDHGPAWHEAGRRNKRSRSVEDLIAVERWLIKSHRTSAAQLALVGASHGGLLVAAALTREPDLIRAAVCISPLLDMVRYEAFDAAQRWRTEYGTVTDRNDFHALLALSPYHRVKEDETYPSVLFVTGDADDRCDPMHVRKMAARLLATIHRAHPVLVDYSNERGHMPCLSRSQQIEGLTKRIAFLCEELGIPLASR